MFRITRTLMPFKLTYTLLELPYVLLKLDNAKGLRNDERVTRIVDIGIVVMGLMKCGLTILPSGNGAFDTFVSNDFGIEPILTEDGARTIPASYRRMTSRRNSSV